MPTRNWSIALPQARRPALLATLLGALLALTACAASPTPTDSPLVGRWQLDPKASDDVGASVRQAVARAQAKMRRHRHGYQFGGGGPGGAEGGADQGPDQGQISTADALGNGMIVGPDFGQLRQRLSDALSTPTQLVIEVTPDVVSIQRDGLPARSYQSGESITRFDEYGTARLDSRWRGPAFEVRQRYTSGARLTERYELDAGGDLVYTRLLEDPTVGKLDVKSVYRRRAARGS